MPELTDAMDLFVEETEDWLRMVATKWRTKIKAQKIIDTGHLLASIKPYLISSPKSLTAGLEFPFYGLPVNYGTHIVTVTQKAKKSRGKSSREYNYGPRKNRVSDVAYSHRYSKRYRNREIGARPFMSDFYADGNKLLYLLLDLAREVAEEHLVVHLPRFDFEGSPISPLNVKNMVGRVVE